MKNVQTLAQMTPTKGWRIVGVLFMALALVFGSCSPENLPPSVIPPDNPPGDGDVDPGEVYEAGYTVSLGTATTMQVSEKIMGFNLIYPHEADAIWADGKLASYIKDINPAFLRWPGGTVASYYHWNSLTGGASKAWADSWDPANPITPENKSTFMDLDEYMALVRYTGATPLVGINMSSGRRWNRQQDGLDEAIALMQYCKDKDFPVTYWYLDNEPYEPGSNGGEKTPAEYAALINAYAPVMKAFDPNIKIVVNWRQAFRNNRTQYNTLMPAAGANIDVIDVHYYWNHSNASWENWLAKTPLTSWNGDTYYEEIAYFRQMIQDFGFPNIKLASLEWNTGGVGNVGSARFTPDGIALAQAEMLMQFIRGGLDYGAFWPLHWPDQSNSKLRSMYNEVTKSPHPNYRLFKFFGAMQGGAVLNSPITKPSTAMVTLAVRSTDGKTVWVCVLNKHTGDMVTDIALDNFPDMKFKEGQIYTVNSNGSGGTFANVTSLNPGNKPVVKFLSKSFSLTMLTLE